MRRIAASFAVALSGALVSACAGRTHPAALAPAGSRAALRPYADSLIADPMFRSANWGVLVVDPESGDTLYSRNAGKLFMPASNEKLLTGATALAQLGPRFRFVTRFATNGPQRDSTLDGDLIVVGRGDPTFSDSLRAGDYRNAFRDMADSVARRGIRRIRGSLRRAGRAFPDSTYGFGWQVDDLRTPSGAVVDELFVNEGVLPGTRVRANGDTVSAPAVIREPAAAFLEAFAAALAERHIALDGAADARTALPDSGLLPMFELRSPPLSMILARMAKPSQNQIAEILFKTLALEKTGVGTADSGRRVVERQLLDWGARADGFAVRDGSGMSRHDYVTPETILRVLDAMRKSPDFPVWYDALPIAGVDGTIASRMKGTSAERNVHAKTGSLDKARSLSGYVTTADGRLLLFSFLCNNFTVPNREVERVQDAILARLASSRAVSR
ncbi:MAG: D-alanyl-D-alanine carboxypeptidase/D-alanyl-D-alanine-endopeptidase [Gemmatimonadales bacterium]